MTAVRHPAPRFPTKASAVRIVQLAREIGLDVDKCAVEFRPDGGVRFMPGATRTEEVDTWGDL